MSHKLGNNRLLKLADHLVSKNRTLDVFNFATTCFATTCRTIERDENGPNGPVSCGTCGCAMGEMPAVWPKSFCYEFFDKLASSGAEIKALVQKHSDSVSPGDWNPSVIRIPERGVTNADSTVRAVMSWFQITSEQADVLFYPHNEFERQTMIYEGKRFKQLPASATARQVANQIRRFVALRANA